MKIPSSILRLVGERPAAPKRTKSTKKEKEKETGKEGRKRSRSHHIDSSPLRRARALLEEEVLSLQPALRSVADNLEVERRRADAATAKAERANRHEREALAKLASLGADKISIQTELVAVESCSRDYQIQLELKERELRWCQSDLDRLQGEFHRLEADYRRRQEECNRYKTKLHNWEQKISERGKAVQGFVDDAFYKGEDAGYEVGYQEGYEKGKRDGELLGIRMERQQALVDSRLEVKGRIIDAMQSGEGGADGTSDWHMAIY